jgi:hypothetical protein
MPTILPFIAAFALSAISTYIQVQAADKKEKRIKSLNADRLKIQNQQANILKAENLRKLGVVARAKRGTEAQRLTSAGGSVENQFGRGNLQGIESSLKGAKDFVASTSGISAQLRSNSLALANAQGAATLGLGSAIAVSALGVGAKVSAAYGMENLAGDDPFSSSATDNDPGLLSTPVETI